MEQNVPKRRHIKFRGRGITQKKTYNILLIFIFTTVELILPLPFTPPLLTVIYLLRHIPENTAWNGVICAENTAHRSTLLSVKTVHSNTASTVLIF